MEKREERVALLGAGRLGALIVKRLPKEVELLVIDKEEEVARNVASMTAASYSTSIEDVQEATVAILTLPAPIVIPVLQELQSKGIGNNTLFINMATTITAEKIKSAGIDLPVVGVKVIGHFREMELGEEGLLVIDATEKERYQRIAELLKDLAPSVPGPADQVAFVNSVAAEEGIRAALRVEKRLRQAGVPEEWIAVALRVPTAGTMKAYSINDLGPFARELVQRIGPSLKEL
ncbi:NAD(P)-binding domain-containing protein [Heliorestis convoluta]|uniref:NAD(P)-binding domain-containing protein n=1 Tax=Heliorestis convoluta TaxID=356322 RepID=UPI001389A475|nr:NAD(P)-binding domain-containing protein [Heliorestis convoluta]